MNPCKGPRRSVILALKKTLSPDALFSRIWDTCKHTRICHTFVLSLLVSGSFLPQNADFSWQTRDCQIVPVLPSHLDILSKTQRSEGKNVYTKAVFSSENSSASRENEGKYIYNKEALRCLWRTPFAQYWCIDFGRLKGYQNGWGIKMAGVSWWTFRYFLFFSARGWGRGSPRRREGGGSVFIESPRGGV